MKQYLYFGFVILILLGLFGCINGTIDKEIKTIEVDLSELPENVTVNNFDLHDIKLIITNNDLSIRTIYVDESMFSEEDLAKFASFGEHDVSVYFGGIETKITIVIQAIEVFNVLFIDMFGNEIETIAVEKGTTVVAPTAPEVQGYVFVGWNQALDNIESNITIQALYEKTTVVITFYVDGNVWAEKVINKGDNLIDIPSIPHKEGFYGMWDEIDFSNIQSDLEVNAMYVETNHEELNQIVSQMNVIYDRLDVSSHVDLISELDGATITWISGNENYIDAQGKLSRPYEPTNITMQARIDYQGTTITQEYLWLLEGYRPLDQGIASGYVYRSYDALSEEFFATMEVIYCAFVLIDAQGGFTGQAINNSSVAGTNSRYLDNMQRYVIPQSKEKGIYAIASLGGGGSVQRDTYSRIAASDTLRKAFATNAVKLINDYGFDGVDVDWETPTAIEKANFTLLMEELYTAVKANNPYHLVTAAITGGMWQPPRYDLENSIQYLDYINVMTYGMSSSNGDYQNALFRSPSYHNQTVNVGKTLTSCSIAESVVIFNNLTVPSSKLIFGLAFYGMRQTYSNGSWTSSGTVFYTSIKNSLIPSGNYQYFYDEVAQVPYLLSNDNLTFISYDDPRSIIAKCTYVLENNLAGVMYWENGCDLTGDLVHAINQGMNK